MKKRTYLFILLTTIVLLAALWGFSKKSTLPVEKLPNVSLLDLQSKPHNLAKIQGKKVVIFFNSQCDHCHDLAKEFQMDTQKLTIPVYWVSSEPTAYIKLFRKKYNLDHGSSITLQDTEGYSYTDFKIRTTPTVMLFGPSGNLLLHSQNFDDASSAFKAIKARL